MRALNKIVRKSNTLIESAHDLTKVEQKLLLLLTSYIKPSDQDFKLCQIKLSDFIQLTGKNHHHYSEIEKIVLGLIKKTLRIIIKDDNGNPTTINTTWLSSSRYTKGSGYIQLRFDPELKPLLLNLKGCFTSFQLKNVFLLTKSSNITMYELLKQYEKIGSRTFKIEELKRTLNIPNNQYKLYGHFKNKIILKAQRELKSMTDICFEFQEIKEGRKVAQIKFIIKKNTDIIKLIDISPIRDISADPDNTELKSLMMLLPEQYQNHSTIENLLKKYLDKKEFSYIARNIEYANVHSNATQTFSGNSQRSNYRGYLQKTLENDFGLAYQEDKKIKQEKEKIIQEQNVLHKQTKDEKQRKLVADKMSAQIEQGQKETAKQHLKSLSQAELQELEIEAVKNMDKDMKNIVDLKKTGWQITLNLKMISILKTRLFPD